MLSPNGVVQLTGYVYTPQPTTVYNLEVYRTHTYLVGTMQAVVHNPGPCDVGALISKITAKYKNFECIPCADAVVKELQQEGIHGEILEIKVPGNPDLWSDQAKGFISRNGYHKAVQVGETVYDNIHQDGISRAAWDADILSNNGMPINENVGTLKSTPF